MNTNEAINGLTLIVNLSFSLQIKLQMQQITSFTNYQRAIII